MYKNIIFISCAMFKYIIFMFIIYLLYLINKQIIETNNNNKQIYYIYVQIYYIYIMRQPLVNF